MNPIPLLSDAVDPMFYHQLRRDQHPADEKEKNELMLELNKLEMKREEKKEGRKERRKKRKEERKSSVIFHIIQFVSYAKLRNLRSEVRNH